MPESLYRYIWQISRRGQLRLCALSILVFPLSMAPLELQRRIIDDAIGAGDLSLLYMLCGVYLAVLLLQGGLKYLLNVHRGTVSECVIRDLRQQIYGRTLAAAADGEGGPDVDRGAVVSMMAAEVEQLGGFVGESLSFPLLQGGTIIAILGYMIWTEPLIALLATALYTPQAIIVPWTQARINRHSRERASVVREIGDFVVDRTPPSEGAKPVPDALGALIGRVFDLRMRIYRLKALTKFSNNFLVGAGPLLILAMGGVLVMRGETELGVIMAFITGLTKLGDPGRALLGFYRRVSNARVKYRLVVDSFADERERRGTWDAAARPA